MKKRKIYYHILLFNMLLLLIGVVIPNQIIYRYSLGFIYKNIHEYNVVKVQQISNGVDGLIHNILEMPIDNFTDIKSSEVLIKPLYEDITHSYLDLKQVMRDVSGISHKNDFVDQVSVFYYKGDVFFYNDTVNYIGSGNKLKITIPQWFETIYEKDINSLWSKYTGANEEEYITYAKTIPFFGTKENRRGIMGITIKESIIREMIANSYGKLQMGQQFIILDEKEAPIVTYPRTDTQLNLTQIKEQIDNQGTNANNLYEVKIGQVTYIASIIPSAYNDWEYIALSSLEAYYVAADQYKYIYYLMFIAIILINIVILYWSSRKAYKPILNVLNIFKSISKEDTKDEYAFIMNTAHNVEFRIAEMNKKLKAYQPLIQSNLIWQILNNAKNDMSQDIFKASGINLTCNKCCCMIMRIQEHASLEDKILSNYKVINAIHEEVHSIKCYTVLNEENDLVLLINYDEELKVVIKVLTTVLESCLRETYNLCVGGEVVESARISQSYNQAKYVKRWTFIKCKDLVLHYDDIANENLKSDGSAYKVLCHIQKAVMDGRIDEVQYRLRSLVEGLTYGSYRIEYCENTLLELCSRLRTIFIDRGFDSDTLLEMDIRELLNNTENIIQLESKINAIVLNMIQHIKDKKDKLPVELEYKIDRCISDHIYNDISLETLADELHISYEVLSKQFKDIKGITFSKYMMELKMKHAKELLLSTDMPVKDISYKLGYNATPYFISRFKKAYGQTPLQYRKAKGK